MKKNVLKSIAYFLIILTSLAIMISTQNTSQNKPLYPQNGKGIIFITKIGQEYVKLEIFNHPLIL